MFLDCPAYLDEDGTVRCGLPAEVRSRHIMRSTDGLLESAMIRCPVGHWFNAPIEFLTWEGKERPGRVSSELASRSTCDSIPRAHGRPDGRSRDVFNDFPDQSPRPNGMPAYYLGRPAWLWVNALSPRRRRATSGSQIVAATRRPDADSESGPTAAGSGAGRDGLTPVTAVLVPKR
jgi:hypothetical protein